MPPAPTTALPPDLWALACDLRPDLNLNEIDDLLRKHRLYCGAPLPVDGLTVVVATRDPLLAFFGQMNQAVAADRGQLPIIECEGVEYFCRNHWQSSRPYLGRYWRVKIGWRIRADGSTEVQHFAVPQDRVNTRLVMEMDSHAARATSCGIVKAEERARQLLRPRLNRFQWECYILCDSFMEISRRSGVIYLLRRNRPTIAFRPQEEDRKNGRSLNPLCALCLHPLGYYASTWTGAYTPSDELIAILDFIRCDEKYFWRKANQIPIEWPEAGL